MAPSPESNSFSVLQNAYEFPEASYVPGFHVTALVSSEVRVALVPMPATSTHSHAPTMSTHASLSATPSLVPKCISPGHAASVDHYPAPPQGHNPSQPQSYIPGSPQPQGHKTVIRSTLVSQSQPSVQLQQTQIIAVIVHYHWAIIEYELPLFSCIKLRMLCNVLTIWNPPLWKRLCSCLVDWCFHALVFLSFCCNICHVFILKICSLAWKCIQVCFVIG